MRLSFPHGLSLASSTTRRCALLVAAVALTACGQPPSEECEQYLECQTHYDETLDRPPATGLNIYQPDGTCWENEQLAEDCTAVCVEKTATLRERLISSEAELGPCE